MRADLIAAKLRWIVLNCTGESNILVCTVCFSIAGVDYVYLEYSRDTSIPPNTRTEGNNTIHKGAFLRVAYPQCHKIHEQKVQLASSYEYDTLLSWVTTVFTMFKWETENFNNNNVIHPMKYWGQTSLHCCSWLFIFTIFKSCIWCLLCCFRLHIVL